MIHEPQTTPGRRSLSTQRALVIGVATAASALIVLATSAIANRAGAQTPSIHVDPIIYPARGQTPSEQSRDRYECYEWSKRQTGFDPTQSQGYASMPPAQASSQSSSMNRAGAMVGGAASGAAIAELTHHDVGRGAAIGVLGGGLVAQAKAQQQQQAHMKHQQAAQSAKAQQRSAYDRALGACMEARGYTVR
jgi:hypothetical protein